MIKETTGDLIRDAENYQVNSTWGELLLRDEKRNR
jgi:hypothetical protein